MYQQAYSTQQYNNQMNVHVPHVMSQFDNSKSAKNCEIQAIVVYSMQCYMSFIHKNSTNIVSNIEKCFLKTKSLFPEQETINMNIACFQHRIQFSLQFFRNVSKTGNIQCFQKRRHFRRFPKQGTSIIINKSVSYSGNIALIYQVVLTCNF